MIKISKNKIKDIYIILKIIYLFQNDMKLNDYILTKSKIEFIIMHNEYILIISY